MTKACRQPFSVSCKITLLFLTTTLKTMHSGCFNLI